MNNGHAEREIRKIIPLTVASKVFKCSKIDTTKDVKTSTVKTI
jgi:hypothetical protein